MRKSICILLVAAALTAQLFAVPAGANERNEENWSSMTYVNVPIYKVFDSRDGYIVIYEKNKIGVGQTVIPKKWANGSPDSPRKLKMRGLPGGKLKSYMTVIKKDGEFHRVILTLPINRQDSVWAVADYRKEIEGTDKDTLEDLDL